MADKVQALNTRYFIRRYHPANISQDGKSEKSEPVFNKKIRNKVHLESRQASAGEKNIIKPSDLDPLFSYFLASGVAVQDIEPITSAFSFAKISKGSFFAEEGKTSRYLAFISRGVFQYYYLKDGKEITTYVTGENTFLASVSSFYRQQPCKEFVRALVDSELWQIHYDDLARLKAESDAFKSFYIGAVEQVLVGIDESRSNLLILTAEERYATLLREEPALLQQIPLQYLASILGVTPRHLSRIRNNIC